MYVSRAAVELKKPVGAASFNACLPSAVRYKLPKPSFNAAKKKRKETFVCIIRLYDMMGTDSTYGGKRPEKQKPS